MRTIFKYPVPADDLFSIEMPVGSNVLCVQVQHGSPFIWVDVDPRKDSVSRYFQIVGTGQDLPIKPYKYIGTFQTAEGNFIWHLYALRG